MQELVEWKLKIKNRFFPALSTLAKNFRYFIIEATVDDD
jgi:hypothetical protein